MSFLFRVGSTVVCAGMLLLSATAQQSDLINLPAAPPVFTGRADKSRPINLMDILSTRKLQSAEMSPDGTKIVFIVAQAFFEKNENWSAMYVVDVNGNNGLVKLQEGASFSQIAWTPDSQFIAYLSSVGGTSQVWRMRAAAGSKAEQVTDHKTSISLYRLSPDGQQLAFLTSSSDEPEKILKTEAQGVVYDGSVTYNISIGSTGTRFWVRSRQQMWLLDLAARSERKVSDQDALGLTISEMTWAPGGQEMAVGGLRPADYARDKYPLTREIGLISLVSGKYEPLITWGGMNWMIKWSPDGKSLAFLSNAGVRPQIISYHQTIFIYDLRSRKSLDLLRAGRRRYVDNPVWSTDGSRILFTSRFEELGDKPGTSSLYQVSRYGGTVSRVLNDDYHYTKFSFSRDQSQAAGVRQKMITPPELVVFNLSTGGAKTIVDVNPEYRNIRLGMVRNLTMTNKYGRRCHGYLVRPQDDAEGTRHPLLVVLYSFGGEFLTDVYGNYPIHAFAENGFALLLMHLSEGRDYSAGNYQEASMSEAYDPLACIEKGVETVGRMGVADLKRTGIMGWSYGSFLTDFAISHAPGLFTAASSGDGGLYTSDSYWRAEAMQKVYDLVFGGPPGGPTHKYWQDMSPPLNAARVRIPVLMEYVDSLNPLQFYTSLKRQGTPVELVFYPKESHVFVSPQSRFFSMRRNLDWFNYWLQNREDPDSTKKDQYARWRKMRDDWEAAKKAESRRQ